MKKLLVLALIGFTAFSMKAQTGDAFRLIQEKKIDVNQIRVSFGLDEEQLRKLKGSPYANETFINGSVFKNDEKVVTNVLMRYNVYSDEIELKRSVATEENNYQALTKDPEAIVKIGNEVYTYIRNNDAGGAGRYFQVLSGDEPYSLCKKIEVRYVAPKYAETSYEKDKPAKFIKNYTYYLVSGVGTFYELPEKKSKILKVMSEKEKEIKKYMKTARLNINKEQDLVKLVSYYNSLM